MRQTLRRGLPLLTIVLIVATTMAPVALGQARPAAYPAVLLMAVGQDRPASNEGETKSGNEAAESSRELLYKTINLLILLGALGFLLRKPIAAFFAGRSAQIRQQLDEGRKALESSEARLRAIEEKLRHLEEDIRRFQEEAQGEMAAERERVRQSTQAEVEKVLQSVRLQIEISTRAAKLELKKYTADEAIRLAEGLLRSRLDESTRSQLFNRFVRDINATQN